MALIMFPKVPLYPEPGHQINWGHPLAKDLVRAFAFTGRQAKDLVSNLVIPFQSGAALSPFKASPLGKGLYSAGGLSGAQMTSPETDKLNTPMTLIWRGIIWGDGSIGNNPPLAGIFYNSTNGAPYTCYMIGRRSTAQATISAFWNDGTTARNIDVASMIEYYKPVTYALVIKNGDVKFYKNGVQIGTSTLAGATIAYSATSQLVINAHITDTTNHTNSTTVQVLTYKRAVTPTELKWLVAEPWGFLGPQAPK